MATAPMQTQAEMPATAPVSHTGPPDPEVSARPSLAHGDSELEKKDVEQQTGPASAAGSPRHIHGIKWFFAVCSILATTFLFALDQTIVADVQPAIIETFHDVSKLPWLSVAFLVAAAGTNLFW